MEYIAYHKDYDWMNTAWNVRKLTAKEISNELNISVKLVHIWLKNHKLT